MYLSTVVMFLAFGGLVTVQYVINMFEFWNANFRSTVSLFEAPMLYIPIIGAKVLPRLEPLNLVKPPFINSCHRHIEKAAVIAFLLIAIIPLALGLPLRTTVKTYSNILNIKGDPIELTILANNVYSFILRYNLQLRLVLDPRFSGHYLYLPFKYVGLDVTISSFYYSIIKLNMENRAVIIPANRDFEVYLSSDKNLYIRRQTRYYALLRL